MVRIANGTEVRDVDTAKALLSQETLPPIDRKLAAASAETQIVELSEWDPQSIRPAAELVQNHHLGEFLVRPDILRSNDIDRILNRVELIIRVYGTGTIPASTNPASHYATHAWTRDAAICAYAMVQSGRVIEGLDALAHLAAFYNRPEERNKFLRFHYHHEASDLYRSPDSSNHPHIKGLIDSVTRQMVRYEYPWAHNQLDAIGMWLFSTFRCANEQLLDLAKLDRELTGKINGDNTHDSIFCVGLKFLNRVRYFDQHDTGPWEDCNLPRRATSIGSCLAAFREARVFFERHGFGEWSKGYPAGAGSLRHELDEAIAEGTAALYSRIDPAGQFAVENDRFLSDSSLSFLLHPFNPGLNRAQEDAIVRALYRDRMGEVGFSRRDDDDYVGMNYVRYPGVMSDLGQPGYRAAEWTLFDPLLASFYYERFSSSGGVDAPALALADRHMKRALSQITKDIDVFSKCDGTVVTVPQGVIPEAYWFDSALQRWRPNENTPLPMSAAAYTFMFASARRALAGPAGSER